MASEKPVLHGPDHLPGGPDPIRGLQGVEYAYVAGIGVSLTHGTTTYWDLAGGASGDPPVTNDDVLFTLDTFTGGSSIGMGGLRINDGGFFKIHTVVQVIGEELDFSLHQRSTGFVLEGTASSYLAGFQSGSQNSMVIGYQSFTVLMGLAAGGYKIVGLSTQNLDVAGAPTGHSYMYVERVDGRDWSTQPFPP